MMTAKVFTSAHEATVIPFFRRVWIGLGAIAAVVLLVCRGIDVMVIRGAEFRKQADENRFFQRTLSPHRGILVDRHGVALVENQAVFKTSASGKTNRAHPPDLVTISAEQALTMSLASPSSVITSVRRAYPFSLPLSHVVGYTGLGDPSKSLEILTPDERVGKAGMERAFQEELRGEAGKQIYEMESTGILVRLLHEEPSIAGNTIPTTIDAGLSVASYEALAGRPGAVVVLDPRTGQVLSLVSSPGVDLADYATNLRNPAKPLLNRAVSAYPPGSTFKMITALAALSTGSIQADTQIRDEGEITVGESVFRNWYARQYGRTEGDITVTRALARSNDIFFYKAAEMAGPDAVAAMARRFHLGMPTGIGLVEEQAGLVPTGAWKEQQIGYKWYLGDTYHMGIGQGFLLASPLQIAAMTGALGMRGTWCTPTLRSDIAPRCESTDVNLSAIDVVVEGMIEACSTGGTAFPFFPWNTEAVAEKKVGCKTGTAEHGESDAQGRKETHAWFTMLYPAKDPKVVITTFLESTDETKFLEGSGDAAPIAKTVWEKWREIYQQ